MILLYSTYKAKLQKVLKYKPCDVAGCKAILEDTKDSWADLKQFEKLCGVLVAVVTRDIKLLRKQIAITPAELSNMLAIPLTTIYNWENGSRKPSQYLLQLIGFVVVEQLLSEGECL